MRSRSSLGSEAISFVKTCQVRNTLIILEGDSHVATTCLGSTPLVTRLDFKDTLRSGGRMLLHRRRPAA